MARRSLRIKEMSPTHEVKCKFLVSNIRPSTVKNAFYSYFGCYGKVTGGKYLHVHSFTPENSHSVLTFTRSFVVKMQLTNDMKSCILRHHHNIDGMMVSVKEYKGIAVHMEELDGSNFKYHFLLQSFTNLTLEAKVIRLLEDLFNGMNCRIRLLQTHLEAVEEELEPQVQALRDWYDDEPDRLPFKGYAVISFFLENEYYHAREIAKHRFRGCGISNWDPKTEFDDV
uniref:uncharacterized protein LOC122600666 n=1 Tax=Erigeron canadensis TaxID=72917 RepID=UPI001CB96896|nr:uncharacterized protein LOC122600666 [Erigeron canadensis]